MAWTPQEYGDTWAPIYDEMYAGQLPTDKAVEALARLAAGGRVLEFGIGTGRLALPLAASGLEVHGVDASEAMVARLRSKPGGDAIPVVVGDFAEARADGRFDLVVLAFNTLFALPSQEAQCRCFTNAAAHLREGGAFIVEGFVPDRTRFDLDQDVEPGDLDESHIALELARRDPSSQRIVLARVIVNARWVRLRYVWPAEMDLMARLAGLELDERWGGWSGRPFTSESAEHISVYRRRAAR